MSELLEKVRAASRRLKVFPLPSAVLLPGAALPLHIFEQRYRDMVKDALATDGIFAMAQVLPGQEGRLQGHPDLEEMLCAGVVTLNEQLEDGRYNLVLVGVARCRVVRELPQTLAYREVEAELLEDAPYAGEEETLLRSAVIELIARLPEEVGQRIGQVAARVRGGALADLLAATIAPDAARRFEVLCELDVRQRLRDVLDDVQNVIARLKPNKPEGLMN